MSALEKSLLELIRRTLSDLPRDLQKALQSAASGEEPGTNGRAALETILHAADLAREEGIPVGGDPVALRFTVEAPPPIDEVAFLTAANAAAHEAAQEGIVRTPMVDLPGGRPRRGKQLGAPPQVNFRRDANAGKDTRVHLRIVGYGEAATCFHRALPSVLNPGPPNLDGVIHVALEVVQQVQGRPVGPGLLGIHVGADTVGGLAAAEAALLRPIGERNPQRPLAQLETRITEKVNQLGIGPLGLGGKHTILATHITVDPAPVDRWIVSVAIAGWACRRQTVTLAKDGSIARWETTAPAGKPKKARPAAEAKMAETPPEEKTPQEKTPAKKTPTKKIPAKKTPAKKTPAEAEPAGAAAKKTATKKTTAKKTAAKKTAAKKTAAKQTVAKKTVAKKTAARAPSPPPGPKRKTTKSSKVTKKK